MTIVLRERGAESRRQSVDNRKHSELCVWAANIAWDFITAEAGDAKKDAPNSATSASLWFNVLLSELCTLSVFAVGP